LHCPKSNKKSSDPKNSLWRKSICLVSWFAQSLFEFHFLVFWLLRSPESGFGSPRTVLAHILTAENVFFKINFGELSIEGINENLARLHAIIEILF
jgi:hypothetical protein